MGGGISSNDGDPIQRIGEYREFILRYVMDMKDDYPKEELFSWTVGGITRWKTQDGEIINRDLQGNVIDNH